MSENKKVHWRDFVRFVKDDHFWNRWEPQLFFAEDSVSNEYYIDAVQKAKDGIALPYFDFAKTNISLTLRDPADTNWIHDGEDIFYFFKKWLNGEYV